MAEPLGPEFDLPPVPREIVDDVLSGKEDLDRWSQAEWAEISIDNPHLRDLITHLGGMSTDPEGVIRSTMIILETLERAEILRAVKDMYSRPVATSRPLRFSQLQRQLYGEVA
jgi:hypothetical protein